MRLLYDKKLTGFYDDLTLSGYYDYQKEAKVIKGIVGDRKKLLELGSGTGNLLIPLAKMGFKVTGIDNSPHMIREFERKTKSKGLDIPNFLVDQRKLSLNEVFDIIVAAGGFAWFATFDKDLFFCTYSETYEDIIKTFQNAYHHLNPKGLFLINVQHHGRKFRLKLRNGMEYHFEITQKTPSKIIKTHYIEDDGKLVFKRAFPQRAFRKDRVLNTAEDLGFKVLGLDTTKSFYIFEK